MTETPPTKPPLRERLKLPDNCVDVTGQPIGEVFVLTGYGTHEARRAARGSKGTNSVKFCLQRPSRPRGSEVRRMTANFAKLPEVARRKD